jgi:glutaredoxin 3
VLDEYKKDGLTYKAIELDMRDDGPSIQSALASLTGRSTVPNVFVGGKSIGGGDDTAAAHRSGSLRKALEAAGAI